MEFKIKFICCLCIYTLCISLATAAGYFYTTRYKATQTIALSIKTLEFSLPAQQLEEHIKSICSSSPLIKQYYYIRLSDRTDKLKSTPPFYRTEFSVPIKRYGKLLVIRFFSLIEFFFSVNNLMIFAVLVLLNIILCIIIYAIASKYLLTPIQDMQLAINDCLMGAPAHGVPFARNSSYMGRLGERFNNLLFQLDRARNATDELLNEPQRGLLNAQKSLSLSQRLSSTGRLAAGIAHEINNPLGGMINAARMLMRNDVSPSKTQDYLGLIMDGLLRIQETVRKIRHFQFCNSATPAQPVDIPDVIRRSIAFIQHKLDRKHITVHQKIPDDLPSVLGNSGDLQQAFLNILKNAMEAIDRDGNIFIELRNQDDYTEIIIQDTGRGMTKEEAAQAFDFFYTTKSSMKGSGLGLAIVHTIIKNHGGKIQIESIKQQGTIITVSLPMTTAVLR